jgi:hypothetical protein
MTQLRRFFSFALLVVMFLLPGKAAAQSGTVTDDAFVSSNLAPAFLANANGQGIAMYNFKLIGCAEIGFRRELSWR